MSREEDLNLAHELLCGAVRFGKKNKFFDLIEGIEYLPSNSEAIARAALARVLVSGDVPDIILKALAGLFDRDVGFRMERKASI